MADIYKYKRKDGKTYYEYRIRYKDPITKKAREKAKKGFKSKPEATMAAAEMEKQLLEGMEVGDISLKHFLYFWLDEYKKENIRKNTYELHEQNIRLHILPFFQNANLKDIKPMMYQRFINHLDEKGYSRRTITIIHGTMYSAYEKAVIIGKTDKNPCHGVTLKGYVRDKEMQFIDSDDIPLFLNTAYKYGYIHWIFFKVLLETGLRKGEAAALQWTDVDLKERIIHIYKTLDFKEASKDPDKMFGDTKTYNSNRSIKISQSLTNDLHFHMKWQNQNKLNLNGVYKHDYNLILCREDGNYMPKSSLFNSFSRILKSAGISPMPIHSTRHTHAVLCLEAGMSMKEIQERLGHGSERITSDVYAHVSKKMEQAAIEKFEERTKNLF